MHTNRLAVTRFGSVIMVWPILLYLFIYYYISVIWCYRPAKMVKP